MKWLTDWFRRWAHVHSCATAPDGHLRLNLDPAEHCNTARFVSYTCTVCGETVVLGVTDDAD